MSNYYTWNLAYQPLTIFRVGISAMAGTFNAVTIWRAELKLRILLQACSMKLSKRFGTLAIDVRAYACNIHPEFEYFFAAMDIVVIED